MKKRHSLTTALLLAILTATLAAAQTDEATRILERADRFRSDWPSVMIRTRIDNYDGEKLSETAEFEVALKGASSLVKFLSPRSKGQSLLMRGDDMWFYLPSVARPVRITPIQRLMGNTANGDLARLRYTEDYSATLEGDEIVNGVPCVILELRGKRKGATYQRIRYAVRTKDSLPVRAEFFLASGRHLKTAFFEEPKLFAGRTIVSRMVIHDQLNASSKTVMEFTDFVPREIADKVFNPARSGS